MQSADPLDSLTSGMRFGPYEIVRLLGTGGMGAVYEATHTGLGKRVALKTLHPHVARNPEAAARFVREGRASARLRHPHVVDVSDVGTEGGIGYLVMEYLEGEDLAHLLGRESRLSPQRIAEIMLPVVSAVACAHEAGIVHRDLKPENIFLCQARRGDVHPKVLDFGISKLVDGAGGHALTNTNALLGTPFYMSPEQTTGGKNLGAASDQYTLGVILYECVAGTRPFKGETLFALMTGIVEGKCPSVSSLCSLPPGFEAMIARAMSREPANRFASTSALGQALLEFAEPHVAAMWRREFGEAPAASASMSSSQPPAGPSHASVPSQLGSHTTLSSAAAEQTTPTRHRRSPVPLIAAAVAVLVVSAGVIALRIGSNHHAGVATPRERVSPGQPSAASSAVAGDRATVEPGNPPVPRVGPEMNPAASASVAGAPDASLSRAAEPIVSAGRHAQSARSARAGSTGSHAVQSVTASPGGVSPPVRSTPGSRSPPPTGTNGASNF